MLSSVPTHPHQLCRNPHLSHAPLLLPFAGSKSCEPVQLAHAPMSPCSFIRFAQAHGSGSHWRAGGGHAHGVFCSHKWHALQTRRARCSRCPHAAAHCSAPMPMPTGFEAATMPTSPVAPLSNPKHPPSNPPSPKPCSEDVHSHVHWPISLPLLALCPIQHPAPRPGGSHHVHVQWTTVPSFHPHPQPPVKSKH